MKSISPGLQGFADGKLWTDEWYQFGPENVPDLHYILGVDETSYNPKADWAQKNRKVWDSYIHFPGIIIMMEAVLFTLHLGIYLPYLTTRLF